MRGGGGVLCILSDVCNRAGGICCLDCGDLRADWHTERQENEPAGPQDDWPGAADDSGLGEFLLLLAAQTLQFSDWLRGAAWSGDGRISKGAFRTAWDHYTYDDNVGSGSGAAGG